MADANQQRAVTAAFAPPPPLWKHFTRDKLDQLERIKNETAKGEDGSPNTNKNWTPEELRTLDLPAELRYLVPPETPTSGQYSVFGELQSVSLGSDLVAETWLTGSHVALDHSTFPERTRN